MTFWRQTNITEEMLHWISMSFSVTRSVTELLRMYHQIDIKLIVPLLVTG